GVGGAQEGNVGVGGLVDHLQHQAHLPAGLLALLELAEEVVEQVPGVAALEDEVLPGRAAEQVPGCLRAHVNYLGAGEGGAGRGAWLRPFAMARRRWNSG